MLHETGQEQTDDPTDKRHRGQRAADKADGGAGLCGEGAGVTAQWVLVVL